jgi:sugar phosphate isomerase/epimerase
MPPRGAIASQTMRRVSLSQITTLRWSFEQDVAFHPSVGVRALGVSVRKLDAIGVARARALLDDAGLAVACLTSSGGFPLDDEAATAAALARTRQHLVAAAELGAECLFVLPGHAPSLAWEEQAACARPLFAALLPEAERLGVKLAIEPVSQLRMDLGFLHGFHDALDFADEFDSRWLGVVLEVNNAWIERGLYRNIRERTDRIAIVQVNDFKVGTLAPNDRVVMGDGDIPLRRICRALADAGYAGWWDIELLGPRIEAEGYESVVPRALAAFEALWT